MCESTIDFHMHALARADACAAPPPRFAGLAPAPLAVSLASSDSACAINRTLYATQASNPGVADSRQA